MNAGLLVRIRTRAENISRKYREVAQNAASLPESEKQKALQANAWRADFVTLDTDVYNELERLYTENERLNTERNFLAQENESLKITVRQQATKLQTLAETTKSAAQTAKTAAEDKLRYYREQYGSMTEALRAYPDLAVEIYGTENPFNMEL
jgi:archaellum component FlaC